MQDRIEIQDLINAYAQCADNREAQKQAELFTENAAVHVSNGKEKQAVQTLHGRKELAEAFQALKQYDVTTHFNGQSTVSVNGDKATNESYCLAHHIKYDKKMLLIMSIRYKDILVKQNGKWLFAERNLSIDWTDNRELKQ
ncbi:SnoaL-like domain-containing protein [Parapedobacter koreensis]|uniref:SnoaL-like domain-containing protein n=2 Tax=Parapedobacter koreensis TaxID=332977 RepID=A0A1H7ITV7_9SPHI|nr:SnoaL-like domain-containing protein [Parapedobacter koreensis]